MTLMELYVQEREALGDHRLPRIRIADYLDVVTQMDDSSRACDSGASSPGGISDSTPGAAEDAVFTSPITDAQLLAYQDHKVMRVMRSESGDINAAIYRSRTIYCHR